MSELRYLKQVALRFRNAADYNKFKEYADAHRLGLTDVLHEALAIMGIYDGSWREREEKQRKGDK